MLPSSNNNTTNAAVKAAAKAEPRSFYVGTELRFLCCHFDVGENKREYEKNTHIVVKHLMARSAVSRLASKYGAVIFFPTFAITCIYADWSHTRAWKQQQQQITEKQKVLSNHQ